MLAAIGTLALAVFLIGLSLSQVLLKVVTFGHFGLVVIGVCGLIAGVLTLVSGVRALESLRKSPAA